MSATETSWMISFFIMAFGFCVMVGLALRINHDWGEDFDKCNNDWFNLATRHTNEWKELCDRLADEKAKLQAKVEELESKIKEMQND